MKQLLSFWLFMLSFGFCKAQDNYAEALQQGDNAFKKGEYKIAINKYFAAEAYDPLKKEIIRERMNLVFTRIETLRKEAEAAKRQAVYEKNNAVSAKNEVIDTKDAFRLMLLAKQMAERDPTIALRIAEAALDKHSDSLIFDAASEIYNQNRFYKILARDRDMRCVAVSRDGTKIVTGHQDHVARLWNADGSLIKESPRLRGPVMSIAFSPDGDKFLTGGYDHIATLWNTKDSTKKEFVGHQGPIMSVAFSPDGSKFVTGGYDKKAKLWDANGESTNKPLQEYEVNNSIDFVGFSQDSKKIFISTQQKTWLADIDIDSPYVTEYYLKVNCIAYTQDGLPVLVGTKNDTIGLYDEQGDLIADFDQSVGRIVSLAYSPSGERILTGSEDGSVRLWNKYGVFQKAFLGHSQAILAITFAPAGESFSTWSRDRTVRSWDISNALEKEYKLRKNEEKISFIDISPDGQKALISTDGEGVKLWNIDGKLLRGFSLPGEAKSIRFSADSKNIIAQFENNTSIQNLTGEQVANFVETAFDISPDGQSMVTGSEDGSVRLLNFGGRNSKKPLLQDTSAITALAYSPMGDKIAVGCNNATISLWTNEGELLWRLKLNDSIRTSNQRGRGVIKSLLFSPDGKKIHVAFSVPHTRGNQRKGFIVDINGNPGVEVSGYRFAFSPDGTKMLDFETSSVTLFNSEGLLLHEYDGSHVAAAQFSSDGKKIITASTDGTIRIWSTYITLKEFLNSGKIEKLTKDQKKEYGIR
ncbi:MAG TPA: WD40 repeat domain-containing protein [Flavitalea sp.]|nr:WD40 repeat domain-containing protein [Flavitalea sp.]